jgi:hypothetical protein
VALSGELEDDRVMDDSIDDDAGRHWIWKNLRPGVSRRELHEVK